MRNAILFACLLVEFFTTTLLAKTKMPLSPNRRGLAVNAGASNAAALQAG